METQKALEQLKIDLNGSIRVVQTSVDAVARDVRRVQGQVEDLEGSNGVHDRVLFEHVDEDGTRHPGIIEKVDDTLETSKKTARAVESLEKSWADAKTFVIATLWKGVRRTSIGAASLLGGALLWAIFHWSSVARAAAELTK